MKIHQKYVHQKEPERNKKDQRNELKEPRLQQHKSQEDSEFKNLLHKFPDLDFVT